MTRTPSADSVQAPAPAAAVDSLAEESRLWRSVILTVLYDQAGDWLAYRVLQKLMSAEGLDATGRDLLLHLRYLEGDGLIEREDRTIAHVSLAFYRLTPRGVDVHEGAVQHPGVGERPGA